MIGIIGSTEITKHKDKNHETITITRRGDAMSKYIPPVIVVCEDKLSQIVIRQIENLNVEIIYAGSWNNFTTLLYGINFYKKQIDNLSDLLPEIVCVIDGDISKEDIIKRIKETHSGRDTNDSESIINKIENDIISFTLEHGLETNNKGIPEFNHKIWLDSIDESIVQSAFDTRLSELDNIRKSLKPENTTICNTEYYNIQKEIEETIRIIDASRSIQFDQKKGGFFDYHKYYKILSRKLESGDTFRIYMIHYIEYTVLSIIKKYNNQAWVNYTNNVKEKIEEKCCIHHEKFKHDYLNGEKI